MLGFVWDIGIIILNKIEMIIGFMKFIKCKKIKYVINENCDN